MQEHCARHEFFEVRRNKRLLTALTSPGSVSEELQALRNRVDISFYLNCYTQGVSKVPWEYSALSL